MVLAHVALCLSRQGEPDGFQVGRIRVAGAHAAIVRGNRAARGLHGFGDAISVSVFESVLERHQCDPQMFGRRRISEGRHEAPDRVLDRSPCDVRSGDKDLVCLRAVRFVRRHGWQVSARRGGSGQYHQSRVREQLLPWMVRLCPDSSDHLFVLHGLYFSSVVTTGTQSRVTT